MRPGERNSGVLKNKKGKKYYFGRKRSTPSKRARVLESQNQGPARKRHGGSMEGTAAAPDASGPAALVPASPEAGTVHYARPPSPRPPTPGPGEIPVALSMCAPVPMPAPAAAPDGFPARSALSTAPTTPASPTPKRCQGPDDRGGPRRRSEKIGLDLKRHKPRGEQVKLVPFVSRTGVELAPF